MGKLEAPAPPAATNEDCGILPVCAADIPVKASAAIKIADNEMGRSERIEELLQSHLSCRIRKVTVVIPRSVRDYPCNIARQ